MEIMEPLAERRETTEEPVARAPREIDSMETLPVDVDVRTSLPLLQAKQETNQLPEPEVMYGTVLSCLMEVFSVRFVNYKRSLANRMYGCILIKNANPTYVVFSRKLGEPLDIDSAGFIKLLGPKRVIEPLRTRSISIHPILFTYQDGLDHDYKVMWKDQFCHDTFMSRRVDSLYGEIEVAYAVYRYGAVAHVDVTLAGCRFPTSTTVRALITAHNSKLGKDGESTLLFDRDDDEGISIEASPCKDMIVQLPLARCKTAVPVGSSLTIDVNIVGTPDQPIAQNEKFEFVARLIGREVKTLRAAACRVNVAVTWSHYEAAEPGN